MGYVRGACSPLTRRHGNLHGISRPLRLAAYWAMGMRDDVFERFPEWDAEENQVRWEEGKVSPSDALVHLLEHPKVALEWLTAGVGRRGAGGGGGRGEGIRGRIWVLLHWMCGAPCGSLHIKAPFIMVGC